MTRTELLRQIIQLKQEEIDILKREVCPDSLIVDRLQRLTTCTIQLDARGVTHVDFHEMMQDPRVGEIESVANDPTKVDVQIINYDNLDELVIDLEQAGFTFVKAVA